MFIPPPVGQTLFGLYLFRVYLLVSHGGSMIKTKTAARLSLTMLHANMIFGN